MALIMALQCIDWKGVCVISNDKFLLVSKEVFGVWTAFDHKGNVTGKLASAFIMCRRDI